MNEPTTKKSLPDIYLGIISRVIDADGVYPHQAVCMDKDGSLQIYALAIDVPTWCRLFWEKVQEFEEVIFGLDMTTRPDQGTRYADALVFVHWTRNVARKLGDPECFRVGVINYQDDPRIVDDIDWTNDHWNHWLRAVLGESRPPFLVRVEKG